MTLSSQKIVFMESYLEDFTLMQFCVDMFSSKQEPTSWGSFWESPPKNFQPLGPILQIAFMSWVRTWHMEFLPEKRSLLLTISFSQRSPEPAHGWCVWMCGEESPSPGTIMSGFILSEISIPSKSTMCCFLSRSPSLLTIPGYIILRLPLSWLLIRAWWLCQVSQHHRLLMAAL